MTDSLDAAYSIRTPEDSVRLYARWAATYEEDFAQRMDWVMPRLVAETYAARGGEGPVLDAGAGTGLLGLAVAATGVGPVDGIDISPEMLDLARGKGVYRNLAVADLTRRLDLPDAAYAGCVSSGTFTHGHVGPEAFEEILRVLRPGGLFVGSIHPAVWQDGGFSSAFETFAQRIDGLDRIPVKGFGPKAEGDHANDPGMIVTFRRA